MLLSGQCALYAPVPWAAKTQSLGGKTGSGLQMFKGLDINFIIINTSLICIEEGYRGIFS
jgi:hypothetical protein